MVEHRSLNDIDNSYLSRESPTSNGCCDDRMASAHSPPITHSSQTINLDFVSASTSPSHSDITLSPSPPAYDDIDDIKPQSWSLGLHGCPIFAPYILPDGSDSVGTGSQISFPMPQLTKQLLSTRWSPHWAVPKKIATSARFLGGYRGGESPTRHPKKTPTIDDATQTIDLTHEIRITNQNVVSHGGFSDIYRGEWDQGTSLTAFPKGGYNEDRKTVPVAVKLLRVFTRKGVDLERSRKRLNREVNVWKRLEHPNIAKFYGVSFQLAKRPALVMQWYENGTAPNYIKDRPISFRLTLVREVCAGLKYLHHLPWPVVHGDLKGNNILVDDDGHAVLSDFGLSKVLDDLEGPSGNTTTTFAGSVRWQAPELLFDGEDEDEDGKPLPPPVGPTLPADVWSFGCTIYELLTGRLPYYHRLYDWRVIQDIMDGVSPLRPDDTVIHQSEDLLGILKDCWTLAPADRPTVEIVDSRLATLSLN